MRLFVGLGNPGKKYEKTRHNLGFLIVRKLADELGASFKDESRFEAEVCTGQWEGEQIHFLLPTTYMNISGHAVRKYMDYYKIPVSDLCVVVDDVALDFGRFRLKPQGSPGGHNGLKSLEQCLGTNYYARLRAGIGEKQGSDLSDHVLGRFTQAEEAELPAILNKGTDILKALVKNTVTTLMNSVNKGEIRESREQKPL